MRNVDILVGEKKTKYKPKVVSKFGWKWTRTEICTLFWRISSQMNLVLAAYRGTDRMEAWIMLVSVISGSVSESRFYTFFSKASDSTDNLSSVCDTIWHKSVLYFMIFYQIEFWLYFGLNFHDKRWKNDDKIVIRFYTFFEKMVSGCIILPIGKCLLNSKSMLYFSNWSNSQF